MELLDLDQSHEHYTVRQATEGLSRLIESYGEEAKKRGVAIAYDSRHFHQNSQWNLHVH